MFWRDTTGRLDPEDTYLRLMDGRPVPGLVALPVEEIVARIAAAFAEGVEDDPCGFGTIRRRESGSAASSTSCVLVAGRP